ncbi:penicillin-binding protein 1A [Treponema zioleckii]|uniref:penicillin-binding protein 1A n=1 Tax=Treponema zioleckii TaxID=331680 RepID=UPI001F5B1105|nr:PBP1A family penicillin-binding protein [Treponema zioleckii]
MSSTKYIIDNENFMEFTNALPTKLLDLNGELITELSSEEKREMINVRTLPQHMLDALISREDHIFYEHQGFSTKALFRAVIGQLLHQKLGGGSTLTQQIAGTLYCDRTDYSYKRKLKELWWAIQMERRYSKSEILELYLNKIYFGGGTYGVSAASKYYFNHDPSEITPAEAAILVVQLSNPAYYNPFDYPNRAKERQEDVLETMVELKYITKAQAEDSLEEYWANFDYTRTSGAAVFSHDDKAPWFSEYVKRELRNLIFGTDDIYTSGFTVNTTLNLKHQDAAQRSMEKYIAIANENFSKSSLERRNSSFSRYVPVGDMIALAFNIPGLKLSKQRNETVTMNTYSEEVNPVVDVLAMMFGEESLKTAIGNKANLIRNANAEKKQVEGTMISVENETGYITAIVGGSKFDNENQFIRAVQARVQPGSSFKPLYYSMAIDSRKFTPGTPLSDTPVVFFQPNGQTYIPKNYAGSYRGDVQVWNALCLSLNIPALKVLDGIGFDAAINRAVSLLGIPEDELASRGFDPGYALGLGVCSVRPIEMARAYAIFANGGREVTPIAIRNVEDRYGNIKVNPEHDVQVAQQAKGKAYQVITPQNAFVMTQLLKNTITVGTLTNATQRGKLFRYTDENGTMFQMPVAGKTGTTQNWADAWTAGYSPYYTAVFWFGFDKPGETLGIRQTGAALAGPAFAEFFYEAHEGLPFKDFEKPTSGIVRTTVCRRTGMIPTKDCAGDTVTLWYLSGTTPSERCTYHTAFKTQEEIVSERLNTEMYQGGFGHFTVIDDDPLSFDISHEYWSPEADEGTEESEDSLGSESENDAEEFESDEDFNSMLD